ncbi:hypothetical protein DNTS_020867 [Danionella cerebrum]|uniref:USP domain-containing protein n=1 Tax=Danionella cerebrum TaxID=2873325 RepID=A0A553QM93_9TELE|nr:hypothetical protein DNTS_020867 [Danionella translucida]TRY90838.1 hypothetical protein DNTS_020867 [Danionella translucida]
MGEKFTKMAQRISAGWISESYKDFQVRGLINYNLSCCVNALLQSFSATTELLDIFYKWDLSESAVQSNVPLQLKKALLSMKEITHPAPHKRFIECLYRHAIYRNSQLDADEIFHLILNLSQKQMNDHELAQELQSLYEIKMEIQVTCSACKYKHRMTNSLFSLPLAIPDEENTLESCVNFLFKKQDLVGSEKFYCTHCENKQESSHELELVSLPQILCIHLKRFRNECGVTRKLTSNVIFPENFEESVFAAGQSGNKVSIDSSRPCEQYSLFAVIVHIGSAMSGHYTAFIRPNLEQAWYYADDSRVNQVTWEDVQYTYKGRNTAYLLLYRKKSLEQSG